MIFRGHGAEVNGGRWNGRGNPALYTACSRALAALEVAVHVPYGIMPIDYYMIEIEVPDESGIFKIDIADLPEKLDRQPIARPTQFIGDDFLKANSYLTLQVPSVTVKRDFNYITNPKHPDFKA